MHNHLKMYKIIFLAVFIVIAETTDETSVAEQCPFFSILGCLQSLQTLWFNVHKVSNKEEAEQVCKQNQPDASCVDDRVIACLPAEQRRNFEDSFQSLKQFMEEMCVEGSTQDAYLRYSTCYQTEFHLEEKCSPLYEEQMRKADGTDEDKSDKDKLKEICCALSNYLQCAYLRIKELCGLEGMDFLQYQADRISSPFLRLLCVYNTDGSCTYKSVTTSRHQIWFISHYAIMHSHLKMYKFIFSAIFIVIAEAIQESSLAEECSLHSTHTCLESLLALSYRFERVNSTKDLEQVCNQNQPEISCLDDGVSACFPDGLPVSQRVMFRDTLEALIQFKEEICRGQSVQNTYLQDSTCYQNAFLSQDKCLPLFQERLRKAENVNEQKTEEDRLRVICCALEDFIQCSYLHVTESCGSDAADFLQSRVDRISDPFLRSYCVRFTNGTCSQKYATPSGHQIMPLSDFSITKNHLNMYKIISLAIFISIAEEAKESPLHEECSLLRLHDCLQTFQTLWSRFDLITTRKDLQQECEQNQLEVSCVDDHVSACIPAGQTKMLDETVKALNQFKEEICLEGPEQETFLQHSHCYVNVLHLQGKCLPLNQELMRQTEKKAENKLKGLCCALEDFIECAYTHVNASCGLEAADFFRQNQDRISSPLDRFLCVHFTDEACPQKSSTTSRQQIWLLSHFTMYVCVLLFQFVTFQRIHLV